MKFLVDVQLPPTLCRWLRQKGNPSRHVLELENGARLPDTQLWKVAAEADEIIITKDWDFYELIVLSQPPPQILHIGLGNCSNRQLLTYLDQVWGLLDQKLRQGVRMISVYPGYIDILE